MTIRSLLLVSCLFLYGFGFASLDRSMASRPVELQASPPLKLLQATSGYLRQIISEMLFIKTSVFLGGVKPGANAKEYEVNLSQNLQVMTSLYPEFIDPYFFTQSFLSSLSKDSAKETNAILKLGIKTYPENFIFHFFYGFNFHRYLDEPLLAAAAFQDAAEHKDAPAIFEHLAAVFSGHGGNLSGGLLMLKTILKGEESEKIRERYRDEIKIFEKAIIIEAAIESYEMDHNKPPQQLKDLVPKYLPKLPLIYGTFVLVYDPPNLSLKRP